MRRRLGRASDDLPRVYRSHVDAVYSFFACSVAQHEAEDLTAATFERVVRSWKSYDAARARERTWVLAIARNLLIDHYRRRAHRDAVSTDEYPGLLERATAGDDFAHVLDGDELRQWLRPLSERAREVLSLRYAADLPPAEIARLLGLNLANVHQILSRSIRTLRTQLEAEAGGGPAGLGQSR
jgi:RNA polymerase sigma-70 factor (ECF subfamily)